MSRPWQLSGSPPPARRQGRVPGVLVVCDFAHHPTAIRVTDRVCAQRGHGRSLGAVFELRSNTMRRKVSKGTSRISLPTETLPSWARLNRASLIDDAERLSPSRVLDVIRRRAGRLRNSTPGRACRILPQETHPGDSSWSGPTEVLRPLGRLSEVARTRRGQGRTGDDSLRAQTETRPATLGGLLSPPGPRARHRILRLVSGPRKKHLFGVTICAFQSVRRIAVLPSRCRPGRPLYQIPRLSST